MTAEDIKWNFERMLSPKSNFRGQLSIIESVKAVDRYTVQLVLKKPWKTLLALLAGSNTQTFYIAPESENKDGSITHPIGTGPFEFVEWKTQDYIKFKRFKDYWEKGLPYLDEVIVKPVPDEMVRLTAIQTGDLHIVQRLSMTNVIELMKKPQKDFYFVPGVEG